MELKTSNIIYSVNYFIVWILGPESSFLIELFVARHLKLYII